MTSSSLLGLALGSALVAACMNTATIGLEPSGSVPTDGSGTLVDSGSADIEAVDDGALDANRARDANGYPSRDAGRADMGGTGDAWVPVGAPSFCRNYPRPMPPGGWESTAVFYGPLSKLSYSIDAEGNRIPDFSYAGFEYGADPPSIPQAAYVAGNMGIVDNSVDDTARIQAAIDQVGQRPIGPNGYRGAVLLGVGAFLIRGVIHIKYEGVVLRGSGHDPFWDQNTILLATGGDLATRVVLGSGVDNGWTDEVFRTRTNVTTTFVPVGSRVFQVADASRLAAGDNIIIVHPATTAWLAALHGGETGTDPPWTSDLGPLTYNRRIVAKSGNELTIDAPIFNHFDAKLSQAYVFKTNRTNIVRHVGIENVFVDSQYLPTDLDRHAQNSIDVVGAEDAWIRDVTAVRFVYAGVRIQNGVRITLSNVEADDPIANRASGRMLNFALDPRSQLVLVSGCRARNGRHNFEVSGLMSSSGNVFLRSQSEAHEEESSGGLRLWSQGLLYDNVSEIGPGSAQLGCVVEPGLVHGHGWAAAHSVLWNHHFDQSRGYAEKPPTAQNYAIGRGPLSGRMGACDGAADGFVQQNDGPLRQESLYEAQLCDRLRP